MILPEALSFNDDGRQSSRRQAVSHQLLTWTCEVTMVLSLSDQVGMSGICEAK